MDAHQTAAPPATATAIGRAQALSCFIVSPPSLPTFSVMMTFVNTKSWAGRYAWSVGTLEMRSTTRSRDGPKESATGLQRVGYSSRMTSAEIAAFEARVLKLMADGAIPKEVSAEIARLIAKVNELQMELTRLRTSKPR